MLNEALRNDVIRAAVRAEKSHPFVDGFDFRENVTGPIVDKPFSPGEIITKRTADGTVSILLLQFQDRPRFRDGTPGVSRPRLGATMHPLAASIFPRCQACPKTSQPSHPSSAL
jgi:hypothetical protein